MMSFLQRCWAYERLMCVCALVSAGMVIVCVWVLLHLDSF